MRKGVPAQVGSAEKIACVIEDQAGAAGSSSIRTVTEAVQDCLFPTAIGLRREFVGGAPVVLRPGAIRAAALRCAVEIAGGVKNQVACGVLPVGSRAEIVQNLLSPGRTGMD